MRKTFKLFTFIFAFLILMTAQSTFAIDENQEELITINFNNVSIETVVRFISEKTGKNFIYDEKLKGNVTIIAPTKLNSMEAYNLFLSVLEIKGYSIVFTGSAYKIVPLNTIREEPLSVSKGAGAIKAKPDYIARIIPLKYVKASTVIPSIKPLISNKNYITAFDESNSILILDTSANIAKILKIIKLIDVKADDLVPEIIYLNFAKAQDVVDMINKDISGAKNKKGKKTSTDISPVAESRLNAIILFGSEEIKREYRELIALLDVATPVNNSGINVYYLENADAEEVSGVISKLVGTGAKKGANASGFIGNVNVTPDKTTNSLIIMASPSDFDILRTVIEKLDRRPKQVFVEAMILEVSLDDIKDLGTKWHGVATDNEKPILLGGVGTVDTSTVGSLIAGMAGLTIGGIGNYLEIPVTQQDGSVVDLTVPGFAALFALQQFEDTINVLSTPHILTSDNREAEIVVGENVPFLGAYQADANSSSDTITQSIERKDVGITLRIKPQVSEGNYVKLDIFQEISAISTSSEVAASGAVDIITNKRSASTTIVVKDRQTVVIGGLIQEKEIQSIIKVPLLGDIPILGYLFKYKTKRKEKTNLLVFLTPTVIDDFEDLDLIRKQRVEKFNEFKDKEVNFAEDIENEFDEMEKRNFFGLDSSLDNVEFIQLLFEKPQAKIREIKPLEETDDTRKEENREEKTIETTIDELIEE